MCKECLLFAGVEKASVGFKHQGRYSCLNDAGKTRIHYALHEKYKRNVEYFLKHISRKECLYMYRTQANIIKKKKSWVT